MAVRPLSGSMATILSPAQSAMALAAAKGERGSLDQVPPRTCSDDTGGPIGVGLASGVWVGADVAVGLSVATDSGDTVAWPDPARVTTR